MLAVERGFGNVNRLALDEVGQVSEMLDLTMVRGRARHADVCIRLEELQGWQTSRLNACSRELEALIARLGEETSLLLTEARAMSDVERRILKPRVDALTDRASCLLRRERLEWSLEWVRAFGDLCADLNPREVEAHLAELLDNAPLAEVGPGFDDQVRPVLAQVAAMQARVEWERVLPRIRAQAGALAEDVLQGWHHLRTGLGDRVWASPLGRRLHNTIAENVVAHGRLGFLLHTLAGTTGYQKIVSELLGDHITLDAVLAELGTLWTLRRNGADADLLVTLGAETGNALCADIRVAGPTGFDIEVSLLDSPSTWTSALELQVRLERGVLAAVAGHTALMIEIRCTGLAENLFRHVPTACEKLATHLNRKRPWSAELAPGIAVDVTDSDVQTQVVVSGATVYRADPDAKEGPRRRLPPKIEEEASQVPNGGVVFIWTSQLFQLPSDAYAGLAADLRNVGERMTNVAAFAVLDSVHGNAPVARHGDLGRVASLNEVATELGSQRLLWVPNPFAVRPLPREAAAFFRLPFGLYL